MSSVNKVILVGNLGRDPEMRTLNNGDTVANLNIATSERWKGKDGDWQEKTEWHRVVIFNPHLAKFAERLSKGSKVYLEGSLQTRKWTDMDGAEKFSTEIVLQKFRGELVLLDGPKDSGKRDNSWSGSNTGYSGLDDSNNIPFAPEWR